MNTRFKKITTLLTLSSVMTVGVAQVSADTITIQQPSTGVTEIGDLISAGFQAAIVIAIIFVLAMIIMGGYGWLTAGGDKAKVEEARSRITNAIIGLAIVATSWGIIVLVANFFGFENFNQLEIPSVRDIGNGSTGGGGSSNDSGDLGGGNESNDIEVGNGDTLTE